MPYGKGFPSLIKQDNSLNPYEIKPPRLAKKLLKYALRGIDSSALMGDFEEAFQQICRREGVSQANRWYRHHLLASLPAILLNVFCWRFAMLYHYMKIAFRNFRRHKVYSSIIIGSLAVGFALFYLAMNYTDFHFSYDQFHRDADRIYSLTRAVPSANSGELHTMSIPAPVLPLMMEEYAEIVDATRFIPLNRRIVRTQDKKFYEDMVCFVDSNILSFFSFTMLQGDPETALLLTNSVVIPKAIAEKYFGKTDPIGKVITLDPYAIELTVTGVTENIPANSSLYYDFLVSPNTVDWLEEWDTETGTFIKLAEKTDRPRLEEKFQGFIRNHLPEFERRNERMYLFPLLDAHLGAVGIHGDPYDSTSPIQFYIILANAVVLLLIVCINFMNLSTARYISRAKEVGMRKVAGADRALLIKQFLGESVTLTILAIPVALLIYAAIRPGFAAIVGGNPDLSIGRNPLLLGILTAVALAAGLLSGSYPAFYLSAFSPASVLKNNMKAGRRGARIRKILVVSQFAMSVILIIVTLVVRKQFDYLTEADLGFNRKNILAVPINGQMEGKLEPLRQEILLHPQVTSAAAGAWIPIDWRSERAVRPEGVDPKNAWTMCSYAVSYDYFETLDMSILQGRSFSKEYQDENSFILSEMAAGQLGWKEPLGKTLYIGNQKGTVIGVARNFHFNHLFFKMQPSVLYLRPQRLGYLLIKCSTPPNQALIGFIKDHWQQVAPHLPFEYFLLDQKLEETFRESVKSAEAFQYISFISILVSGLGLLGLTLYSVERRTKEIGIRKVLGASSSNIVRLLMSEFLKLVILANLLAAVPAYLGAKGFLQWAWVAETDITIFVFLAAAGISLAAAFLSVIFQTLRAAWADPVHSLRYE